MKKRIDHYESYKDPAAKVFSYSDEPDFIFRELDTNYLPHFNHFKSSGLSTELLKKKWIVSFEEFAEDSKVILKASKISFISYPYEWTFNQWKDAALLTLKIQYQALKHGMILKDATPFNIVFDCLGPVFVDLSSFEIYKEGSVWQAFKQFCENFYMPLLLAKYFDETANEIYLNNLSGISLTKGLSLLPAKAFFNFSTLLYLAMPERIRSKSSHTKPHTSSNRFTAQKNMEVVDDLFNSISKLKQKKLQTKWNDYYETNINASYLKEKESIVDQWIDKNYTEKTVVDFGCNTGNFSRLVSASVKKVIAFDADIRSVDELYLYCGQNKIDNIYCLRASITEPSPALGWNNMERQSLKERIKADAGLALALIHHLAISNYIQFDRIADFFADCCDEMLVEFVPKEDEKVQLLLRNREDIFDWYNIENFLSAFIAKYNLVKQYAFSNNRVLFHFIKQK